MSDAVIWPGKAGNVGVAWCREHCRGLGPLATWDGGGPNGDR